MCEKCKELAMCPVGEKRIVEVAFPVSSKLTDAYNKHVYVKPWIMFVDKYPNGEIDSGLFQEIYDENHVNYGSLLSITHCPFCGEKIAR